jgi:hypothetical protein
MPDALILERTVVFHRRGRSRKRCDPDEASPPRAPGRVPRVTRLLALALRFDQLLRTGAVADRAILAHLGQVSRARLAQILNLLNLAPDLQEQILFLSPTRRGRDPLHLAQLQPIALTKDWQEQRRLWARLQDAAPVRNGADG